MLVGGWFLGGPHAQGRKTFRLNPVSTRSAPPLTPVRQVLSGGHVLRYLRREALYLFAWSTSIRESGWVGLWKLQFLFLCYWQVWFIWCVWRAGLDARAFTPRAYEPGNDSIANRQR